MTFPATLFLLRLPCATNLASHLTVPSKTLRSFVSVSLVCVPFSQTAVSRYIPKLHLAECLSPLCSANPSTASLVFWFRTFKFHWIPKNPITIPLFRTKKTWACSCSSILLMSFQSSVISCVHEQPKNMAGNDCGTPTIKVDGFQRGFTMAFPHLCRRLPKGNDCCFLHVFIPHLLVYRRLLNWLIDVNSINGLPSLIIDWFTT